jgi:predicted transcriptional regulator
MLISPRQIRAARALLGWTRTELADRALLSITTISDIERGDVDPKATTLTRITTTLEKAGVEFIWPDSSGKGEGVRLTSR